MALFRYLRQSSLLFTLLLSADAAQLSITQRGGIELRLSGDPAARYALEQSLTPAVSGSWKTLLELTLKNGTHDWTEPASRLLPLRFYRLRSILNTLPVADNFRLIDHLGISRELSYDSTPRSVVLIFTSSDAPNESAAINAINLLRERFEPLGVAFWLVDSSVEESRTKLMARAEVLAIKFPALHDRGRLVTRSFGIENVPSAICISTEDWTIFYRGSIGTLAPSGLASSQNYLAEALSSFLSGQQVALGRVEADGWPLSISPPEPISYARDIAPLLKENCVRCHSPGNIAPWAMTNHAVVQTYAASIKAEVLTGRMPPWHADPLYGEFVNDVSLNPQQAGKLLDWIDAGAPRGEGADPLAEVFATSPPALDYPHAWPVELGQPDVVLTIPVQSVPARGEVPYKYPQVSTRFSSNVWLRAAVVLPGNTRVVHHCLVFSGSFLEVLLNGGGLTGFFAGYVPGSNPTTFPSGTGKLLPANATLTFQMHYTTTGKAETDQTKLGLYFMKEPPTAELFTRSAATAVISIPPGEREYLREAEVIPSATRDIWLYEMSPHMHYRGSWFKYEAIYPNGTSEVLLSVPKYDFHWQSLYRLAQPKRLPAGTKIRCTGAFDNSPQNPDNPNPNATVSFGEQTDDEMFIGYLNYSVIP